MVLYVCLCVHVSTSVCACFFFPGVSFPQKPGYSHQPLFFEMRFFFSFRSCGEMVRSPFCLFVCLSIYWEFIDPPSKKG